MALSPSTLSSQILTLTDPDNGAFVGFPENVQETADNWAAVARGYLSQLTVPATLPSAFDSGESAFAASMKAALQGGAPLSGLEGLKSGFVAFAASIVTNVAPTPLGVTVVPPGPPAIVFSPPGALSVQAAAQQLASQIDVWVRTGTFTPQTPPGAAPTPWV